MLAILLVGCSAPEKELPELRRERVDALAIAFAKWVHLHYATRLSRELGTPGPSDGARQKAREELKATLAALGLESESGELKGITAAVRDALTSEDYIFLPLAQGGETDDEDLGVALAHVRERRPGCRQELWGREVRYKLVLYDPFVRDYPGWKARTTGTEGPVYSPGRFAGDTVYIDHSELVKRAKTATFPHDRLGIEGLRNEVELRQAAYLLFLADVPGVLARDPAVSSPALVKLHERVLWTAVRYGDPDAALADVQGLAEADLAPTELRLAARRVRARFPRGVHELPSKEARARALHAAADEAWAAILRGRGAE